MTEILLCGCRGVMGRMITECSISDRFSDKLRIAAGVDIKEGNPETFPVFKKSKT